MDINIQWSDPVKMKLPDGGFAWRRQWMVPVNLRNGFFLFWKKRRYELKPDGYGVYKSGDEWYFTETKVSCSQFQELGNREEKKEVDEDKLFILPYYGVKNTDGLRPWQISAVSKLAASIEHYGAALDGSDLGTGKTYSAVAVAREMGMNMVVVSPKQVMTTWTRVINNHFKMSDKLIGIINYEQLRIGKTESPIASIVWNRKQRRNKFTWKIPKNTLIIWDEAQKLKNWKTKNSKTCLAAQAQGFKQLFCTATMAVTPMDLRTVGTCLKMFKTAKDYYEWLYRHGVSKGRFGLEFDNNLTSLEKIHKELSGRGVRLVRDEIPGFPESEIIADPYNMSDEDTAKINSIWEEMKREISLIEKREKSDEISRMAEETRARQKVEMIKVPLFVEMVEESIEEGLSVVIFVNYTETVHALAKRLNTDCIYNGEDSSTRMVKVNGEDKKMAIRDINVDLFQENKKKVIIINLASGGAGLSLHDLHGGHPRVALISPSYDPRHFRQSLGRVWRDGAKTKSIQKIVFVAGTVEDNICRNVQQKLKNMDMLNDGDLKYINQYEIVKN